MIRDALLKYLEDEVLLLSTDKVENQIKHIKNLQVALESLVIVYEKNNVIQSPKEIKQN